MYSLQLSSCVGLAGLLLAAAFAPAATFTQPSFFGQANSTVAEWQGFTAPVSPNVPTTFTNAAGTPDWFDRTAATDGAFNIGAAPAARIYSFSGVINPQVNLPLPDLGVAGLTTIVLQAAVAGTGLDAASFVATGPDGVARAASDVRVITAPGTMGSSFQYTATWSDLPSATRYALTYSAAGTSSSQQAVRVDSVSAVPEPTALAGLAIGGGLLFRRRRVATV